MCAYEKIRTTSSFGVATFALLSALIAVSSASDPVYLRSHDERSAANSINLRWVNGARGSRPINSVRGTLELDPYDSQGFMTINEAEEEDPEKPKSELIDETYVCRVLHQDASRKFWLPGHLNASSTVCTVSQDGYVYAYSTYQVLQNGGGASKLSWIHWDRTSGLSSLRGAVDVDGSGTYYVARWEGSSPEEEKRSQHVGVGKLDLRERSNHIAVTVTRTPSDVLPRRRNMRRNDNLVFGEVERIYDSGKVLVAAEPRRYEVSIIDVNKMPKSIHRQKVVVATGQLVNNGSSSNGDESPLVNCVLSYEDGYSITWGPGKGILRGLPTKMLNHGEDVQETVQGKGNSSMNWGQAQTWKTLEKRTVEERLPLGTAANVSLIGNKTHTETICTALVTIFYGDGSKVSRNMSVTRKMEKLDELQVEVGPAYFVINGSLATTPSVETTTQTEVMTELNSTPHTISNDETYFHPYTNNTSSSNANASLGNANDKPSTTTVRAQVQPTPSQTRGTNDPSYPILEDRMGRKHEYETVLLNERDKKHVPSSAPQTRSTLWSGLLPTLWVFITYSITRTRMLRL